MSAFPPKDPDEILDYSFDWSRVLDGDTISASVWTVPTGLTSVTTSKTPTTTTVWLGGGTLGGAYTLTNRVTTAGSRVFERSASIRIVSK